MTRRSPLGESVTIADVGAVAAFLASPAARHLTGGVIEIDAGLHLIS
jgi:enoyl-[acyl-carrier protein] reductase I